VCGSYSLLGYMKSFSYEQENMMCDMSTVTSRVNYVLLIPRPGGVPLLPVDPVGLRNGRPLTEPGLVTPISGVCELAEW